MIELVTLDNTTFAAPPLRFEAGTPAIAEAIGFGAAVDYLSDIGMARLQQREAELGGYLYQQVLLYSMQGTHYTIHHLPVQACGNMRNSMSALSG